MKKGDFDILGKYDTFLKTVKSNLIEHSPEILTGLGIASMFGADIFSIKATPQAK